MKNITRLIIEAYEKENEDKNEKMAWDMWVSIYPKMRTGEMEIIQFYEFKEQLFKNNNKLTQISYEEIEEEFEKIIAFHEGQVK